MIIQSIVSNLRKWREYRANERHIWNAVRELSKMSDRDLRDLGIDRADIETVARQTGPA